MQFIKELNYLLFFLLLFFFLKFNSEKRKMYNIDKIPNVLNIAKTMNQVTCPFLADFHNAKSFQTASQINIVINNHIEIPNELEIEVKYSFII